jgi:hypothetical protein
MRVRLGRIVERKEVFDTVLVGVGRLSKPLVELAPPAAGDDRYHAVVNQPIVFVLVQPSIQELAQEATALGAAEAVGIVDLVSARIALLR